MSISIHMYYIHFLKMFVWIINSRTKYSMLAAPSYNFGATCLDRKQVESSSLHLLSYSLRWYKSAKGPTRAPILSKFWEWPSRGGRRTTVIPGLQQMISHARKNKTSDTLLIRQGLSGVSWSH